MVWLLCLFSERVDHKPVVHKELFEPFGNTATVTPPTRSLAASLTRSALPGHLPPATPVVLPKTPMLKPFEFTTQSDDNKWALVGRSEVSIDLHCVT